MSDTTDLRNRITKINYDINDLDARITDAEDGGRYGEIPAYVRNVKRWATSYRPSRQS